MNNQNQKSGDMVKEVTEQATLDSAFLLAYKDARGDCNRIMNREDFRKGWNQCLIAFGVEMQVPEDVWDKYQWRKGEGQ